MKFIIQICFLLSCGIPFVASFTWENCGSDTDMFKIISLEAFSNGTKLLYVTGEGKVGRNVTAPIKGQVDMQKKFFWGWTQIPCVDQVGSCTYEDLCQLSPYEGEECPPDFTRNALPCTCPILEGRYVAKKFPVNLSILPHWIEEGKYRIRLTLTQNGEELICIRIYIKF